MKAPNGKDSNLPEQLWLTVRTKAFKNWFGDWENLDKKKQLENAPVTKVKENIFVTNKDKSAREQAIEWAGKTKLNETYNTVVGTVVIDKRSIKDSLGHGYSQKKLDTVASLKDGFRNAVYLESVKDFDNNDLINHYFVYPITYKGQRELVFCRARKDVNLNRLYVHEVFTESELKNKESDTLQTAAYKAEHGGIALYKSILQKVLNVNEKDVSKVVDANGEPLVCYHGSEDIFSIFDITKGRANMDIQGSFFSPYKIDAQGYGKNIYPVFLNIKNPATESKGYSALNKYQGQNGAGIKAREDLIKQGYDGVNNENTEYIVFDSRQVKSINNRGTFDKNNPDIYYQPAYHGTPHKFDEFSTDKIGTGEGAQAHGWGLYFAENKDVSENYRKALASSNIDIFSDGKKISENDKLEIIALISPSNLENKKDFAFAVKNIIAINEDLIRKNNGNIDERKRIINIFKKINLDNFEIKKQKGQLFKVDIPENDVLLDEDKTFDEQPKKVQEALLKVLPKKINTSGFDIVYAKNKNLFNPNDELIIQEAYQLYKQNPDKYFNKMWNNLTGRELYGILVSHNFGNSKEASLALNNVGIKGITYDGQQDGRAYVIFDDKAVKILEKFYQADRARLSPEQFEKARQAAEKVFKEQLTKFRQNNFTSKKLTLGVMLPYYQKYGMQGILRVGVGKLAEIRDKHPQEWQHIDDTIKNIDSPMAIMVSQNKKDPYTLIVFTDIITKDKAENESVLGYLLRPAEDGSIMVSTYNFYSTDIDKHIKGLKAVDKEKAEKMSGVGAVKNQQLAISIKNTLSAEDSIADLKEKYKNYYYKQGDENPRGATTIYDRQYYIDLFANSDKSTLLHETSHPFLNEILYFASAKNASKRILYIKRQLDNWLGEPEDNGRYSKRQQELFATSAESFFREGKAPTAKLKTVFKRFQKWLSDIYDRIKDDLPKINDDVKELFDTILSKSYDVPDSNIYAGKEKAIKDIFFVLKKYKFCII